MFWKRKSESAQEIKSGDNSKSYQSAGEMHIHNHQVVPRASTIVRPTQEDVRTLDGNIDKVIEAARLERRPIQWDGNLILKRRSASPVIIALVVVMIPLALISQASSFPALLLERLRTAFCQVSEAGCRALGRYAPSEQKASSEAKKVTSPANRAPENPVFPPPSTPLPMSKNPRVPYRISIKVSGWLDYEIDARKLCFSEAESRQQERSIIIAVDVANRTISGRAETYVRCTLIETEADVPPTIRFFDDKN